ncbi:MAG: aminotransferase class IV [Angustibacter sp.]
MHAWVDGRVIQPGEPAIRADDHGITVGNGVFETLKVVDGVPFALTRHLRRLVRSALGLGLAEPDLDRVHDGIRTVLAGSSMALGRLRITVTGGPGPLGSNRGTAAATAIVLAAPYERLPASTAVVAVPWVRNERSAVAGLKTTSYADNVVALAYARERGATEALFGNTRARLCEGTGSNVIVALDGELVTPPLASGCLAGVTRELVLEWSADAGHPVIERDIPLSVLQDADEVLLTSSTRDVQSVHAVDGRRLAIGLLGRRAAALFTNRAAADLDP